MESDLAVTPRVRNRWALRPTHFRNHRGQGTRSHGWSGQHISWTRPRNPEGCVALGGLQALLAEVGLARCQLQVTSVTDRTTALCARLPRSPRADGPSVGLTVSLAFLPAR